MQLQGACDADDLEQSPGRGRALPRIRGWLIAYIVGLSYLLAHGAALTTASIVIYSDPAVAGLHSFIPLSSLLFYVVTNAILIVYGPVLFILMFKRRRSAIVNNVVFNILSIAFLVAWHLLGEKSNVGTFVDIAPNLLGVVYFLLSRRVRDTFIISPRSSLLHEERRAGRDRA
jgi:hypothetical protein